MGRSFYVCESKNGKFTAEFLEPKTGLRICARTINAKSFSEATDLKDRRAHGKDITLRTCSDNLATIKSNWEPYFAGKKLAEITRQDLKLFGIAMSEHVAGKTINNRLLVGTKALRWAFLEKMIPEDVTEGLGGFANNGKKRDILTMKETADLFNEKHWDDEMAYVAAMLAATSGLRNGEIRALKAADIGNTLYSVKTESGEKRDVYLLYVRHGWNYKDGLKLPKNNEEGAIHLLPERYYFTRKSPAQTAFYQALPFSKPIAPSQNPCYNVIERKRSRHARP